MVTEYKKPEYVLQDTCTTPEQINYVGLKLAEKYSTKSDAKEHGPTVLGKMLTKPEKPSLTTLGKQLLGDLALGELKFA